METQLEESVKGEKKVKIHNPFKRLAPFKDAEGVWRVGWRVREFVPFTRDKKPPAILPKDHRFTRTVMLAAHNKGHVGVVATVFKFRIMGFWVTHATILAKTVKNACVICRYLDKTPMYQEMGSIPKERFVNPVAWGDCELDLFGPYKCRSDVNKEVVKALKRFGSLRGWPSSISSDQGSQLESAQGALTLWWEDLQRPLLDYSKENKFQWKISPANSPWRQGKSESRIQVTKRLLKVSMGGMKLTPLEFQTVLFEAAALTNERPIGIHKKPLINGTFKAITPNDLRLGRSTTELFDDVDLGDYLKKSERLDMIKKVTDDFWSKWANQVIPEAMIREKWHESSRNLSVGDVVLVLESSPIKGKYKLAIVEEVFPSKDNLVRSGIVCASLTRSTKPIIRRTVGSGFKSEEAYSACLSFCLLKSRQSH